MAGGGASVHTLSFVWRFWLFGLSCMFSLLAIVLALPAAVALYFIDLFSDAADFLYEESRKSKDYI